MQYADIPFPPRLALGLQRSPTWSTSVARAISGFTTTNQEWADALHEYDASFAVRTATDYDDIVAHFHMARGRAKKWPLKDPLDYRCTVARGILLDDGDSPTTDYRLAKTYGSGTDIYRRRITRPIASTVAIYRRRAGTTTDITANATINATNGRVSFSGGTIQFADVLSWAGQFYTPCMFDTDKLPGLVVEKNPGPNGELLVQCSSIPILEVLEA